MNAKDYLKLMEIKNRLSLLKKPIVYHDDALEAVRLARKEERKKQFTNVMTESAQKLFDIKKIKARVRLEMAREMDDQFKLVLAKANSGISYIGYLIDDITALRKKFKNRFLKPQSDTLPKKSTPVGRDKEVKKK